MKVMVEQTDNHAASDIFQIVARLLRAQIERHDKPKQYSQTKLPWDEIFALKIIALDVCVMWICQWHGQRNLSSSMTENEAIDAWSMFDLAEGELFKALDNGELIALDEYRKRLSPIESDFWFGTTSDPAAAKQGLNYPGDRTFVSYGEGRTGTTVRAQARTLANVGIAPAALLERWSPAPDELGVEVKAEPLQKYVSVSDDDRPIETALKVDQIANLAVAPVHAKPKPTNSAVKAWIEKRIATFPNGQRTPSADDDWKKAKAYFASGLQRDAFRELRDRLVPESWKGKGKRPIWQCAR